MVTDEEFNRISWASRRGMLELDLVLQPFVARRYRHLSDQDRHRYQQLMLSEDQDLFAWFLRREQPEDPEIKAIVNEVLAFTRTRPDG
jgi:antitoxin CptB